MRIKLTYSEILLSILTGIIVGLITIFVLPNDFELLVWILLVFMIAFFAKRQFKSEVYLNTLLLAVIVGFSITTTHLLFLDNYLDSHKSEIAGLDEIKIHSSYGLTLFAIAPVYWLVLGLLSCIVLGLVNRITGKK